MILKKGILRNFKKIREDLLSVDKSILIVNDTQVKCCIKTGRDFVCSSSISSFLRHWIQKLFWRSLFRSFMRTCAHSAMTLHCAAEHFLLSSSPTPSPCWGARWGQGQEVCVSWGARRGGRWGGRFDCRARAGEAQRWETGINNAAPQEGARSVWVNPLLGGRDCPSADGSLRGFVHQLFNREFFFFFLPRQRMQRFITQFCSLLQQHNRSDFNPEIRLVRLGGLQLKARSVALKVSVCSWNS